MAYIKCLTGIFLVLGCSGLVMCEKINVTSPSVTPPGKTRTIVYEVKGTRIKMNFIDSNSVFREQQVFYNSFRYQFQKGSGASIGFSITRFSPVDEIYSWNLFIDGKLYANSFSEGGVYMTVPYN
jgi:hypothetical protein